MILNKSRVFYIFLILIYIIQVSLLSDNLCTEFYNVPGYGCETGYYRIHGFLFFIILILSLFMPIYDKKPSSVILNILFLFSFIPTFIYFPKEIQGNEFSIILYSLYMFISFLLLLMFSKVKISFKSTNIKPFFVDFILISIAISFIILIVSSHGLKLTTPNITDVYSLRAEYKENASSASGYAVVLGGYVISPLIILLYLNSKRKFIGLGVPIVLFLTYIIFSSSGIKSIALSIFVIVGFYYLFKNILRFGYYILVFVNILIFINYLIYTFITNNNIIYIHWLRRVITSPGSTAAKFFEYFYILGNTPTPQAPKIIANYYFSTNGSANTGFFLEGIGRFGLHGLIINTAILAIFLIVLNGISKSLDKNLLACLLVMVSYAMCNSSFLTVIVTYGLLLLTIVSVLLMNYPMREDKKWKIKYVI